MTRKPRRPKSVIERQTIPCLTVKGGEPMQEPDEGGFLSLLGIGNRYWSGSAFIDDPHEAQHFIDSEAADKVVSEVRKAGVRAAVCCMPIRADFMTPAQLRVFLQQVREDEGNIRLLAMIGSFWKEDVAELEREEWCHFVEERAKLP
jgi:hypothetical protein